MSSRTSFITELPDFHPLGSQVFPSKKSCLHLIAQTYNESIFKVMQIVGVKEDLPDRVKGLATAWRQTIHS